MRASADESNGKSRIIPDYARVYRLGSPNLIAVLAMCLMTAVGENISYCIYNQSMGCPLTLSTHIVTRHQRPLFPITAVFDALALLRIMRPPPMGYEAERRRETWYVPP